MVLGEINSHSRLRRLAHDLRGLDDFVIKPNRGSAGRGVLVIVGRTAAGFLRHNGQVLTLDDVRQHLSDILSGMYSLAGRPDRALLQQRIRLHPAFARTAYKGTPDVRVIVYRNQPAMAMLRLPTKASNGRANLHQGAIGVGVDLASGFTHHAVQGHRFVLAHPDTGVPVIGMRVPYWTDVLAISQRVAEAVGMGYVGVDVVIDAGLGPMLLEANARPGLAIQIANARGLLPRLAEIDMLARRPTLTRPQDQDAVAGGIGKGLRRSA
jgi:alpha-L-glutamate ligase-like protein